MQNRLTDILGVEYPILQAPMGYIARAQLASAVSNAGGLGVIETSSGQLAEVRDEITRMRDLTDKPFGVNIAQMLVRDPGIVDFVHDQGVRFVTTSAGDPGEYTPPLHEAGITVFHVVPTLRAALKAVRAGVDGIVAEGGEGGGFKASRDVSTMVLLPLVCSQVEVPVVAAGGICEAGRWRPRSPSARRGCSLAPGWCRRQSHRCTRTTNGSSSRAPRPGPCSSTAGTSRRFGCSPPSAA